MAVTHFPKGPTSTSVSLLVGYHGPDGLLFAGRVGSGFSEKLLASIDAYTFRDERDLLWYSLVFSSADRESAYVIDGLMHNDVVQSDIHSTDAFGYSEAILGCAHETDPIFATSYLLGFSYAPRFKNLKRQRLYIFKNRQKSDIKEVVF